MPISGCCTYSQTHLAIYSWESFTYQTSYRICVLPGAAYFHTSSLYTNHLASSAVGPNPQITYDYPANLWLQEINVRLHSLDRATSHVHAAVTTAKSGNAESGGEEAATKHRLTACQEGRTVISQTVTLKGPCRPHCKRALENRLPSAWEPTTAAQPSTHVRVSVTVHGVLGYLFLSFYPLIKSCTTHAFHNFSNILSKRRHTFNENQLRLVPDSWLSSYICLQSLPLQDRKLSGNSPKSFTSLLQTLFESLNNNLDEVG